MSLVLNPFTGNFDEVSDLAVSVGASPNANASTVVQAGTSILLTLQPADGTNPGIVSTGAQTLAGAKTLTAALTLSSNQIHSVADPTSAQDAATKAYVDASVAALNPAAAVYAASTANIPGTYLNGVAGVGATFTTTATGTFTIDGVTPPLAARILIKDQSSGFQNGIYDITTLGTTGVSTVFTRSLDYNTAADMNSAGLIPVINGTVNSLSSWQQTAPITTVGTDSLVFQEFTANPSLYLLKANNLSDVANKTTSFNNLSPMTTQGDIIYGGTSGSGTRLAKGTQYQTLQGGATIPLWDAVHLDQATAITGTLPIGNGGTGNTSGTATINANMTGDVTSVGNATTYAGTVPLNKGGTGQTTKAAAFDALQPMTTGGDIIYGGASGTGTRLANGSAGQFLKSQGTTLAPIWAAVTATPAYNYTAQTTTYNAVIGDIVNCTTGTFTVTLPTAVSVAGQQIVVTNTGTGVITIATTSAQTIGGITSGVLKLGTLNDSITVSSDGANWLITSTTVEVSVRAHGSTTTITNSLATIVWTTTDYDALSILSSGTVTIPYKGKYHVESGIVINGTYAVNVDNELQVQKNGTAVGGSNPFAAGAVGAMGADFGDVFDCIAGDTVRIQVRSGATGPTVRASNVYNYFSLIRVGN